MLSDHRIRIEDKERCELEPELQAPVPRRVRRRKGRGFLINLPQILLIPFLLLGLLLIYSTLLGIFGLLMGRMTVERFVPILLVTIFWNGCNTIFFWKYWVLPIIHRWLVINGQTAEGRITSISAIRGRSTGPHGFRVEYEFAPAGGLPLKARMEANMFGWAEFARCEIVATILYSAKNPRWSVPYCCTDYEVLSGK